MVPPSPKSHLRCMQVRTCTRICDNIHVTDPAQEAQSYNRSPPERVACSPWPVRGSSLHQPSPDHIGPCNVPLGPGGINTTHSNHTVNWVVDSHQMFRNSTSTCTSSYAP